MDVTDSSPEPVGGGREQHSPIKLAAMMVVAGFAGGALAIGGLWAVSGEGRLLGSTPDATCGIAEQRLAALETEVAGLSRTSPAVTARPARPTMTLRIAAGAEPEQTHTSEPQGATSGPRALATATATATTRPTKTAAPTRTPRPIRTPRATATLRIVP